MGALNYLSGYGFIQADTALSMISGSGSGSSGSSGGGGGGGGGGSFNPVVILGLSLLAWLRLMTNRAGGGRVRRSR